MACSWLVAVGLSFTLNSKFALARSPDRLRYMGQPELYIAPHYRPSKTARAFLSFSQSGNVILAMLNGLPAHHHVRFDHLAGTFQVFAGLVHVDADGVNFVAASLRQTVARGVAGI